MRTSAAIVIVAALSGSAWGQCTPEWDTTIGNPGISGGYAAPIRGWNDGSGEKIYVGGSFGSAGGSAANQYLARWDPTAGWSSLGSGISGGFTNAFMTALVPFNPGNGDRLVACGFYDTAGGVPQTASLAMWNGQAWEAMGTLWTGSTRGSIWSAAVWNGRLHVGGGVVNQPGMIAGLPWAGMASWNGQPGGWATHISSIAGFSPYVGALQVFDDGSGEKLYAGGRFTSINGMAGTSLIARWDGTSWSSVGGGLTATSTFAGLEGMTIFNDGGGPALYVAGGGFIAPGQPATNVAKWNGTGWTPLGGLIGTGRLTSIAVFDDGTGSTLYIGGTAMPQINQIARWRNSQWQIVDGGCTGGAIPPSNFPSVFGLGVVGNRLYVGGNFVEMNTRPASGLVARTSCAVACYANCDGSTGTPALNVDDFVCFSQRFAAADPYADCNHNSALNVEDFVCFQAAFAAGCR